MDSDFLDDVLREGGDLPWYGDVVAVRQSQPAVCPLAASIHLSVSRHNKKGLRPAGDADRFEQGQRLGEHRQLDLGAFEAAQLVLVVQAPNEDLGGVGGDTFGFGLVTSSSSSAGGGPRLGIVVFFRVRHQERVTGRELIFLTPALALHLQPVNLAVNATVPAGFHCDLDVPKKP